MEKNEIMVVDTADVSSKVEEDVVIEAEFITKQQVFEGCETEEEGPEEEGPEERKERLEEELRALTEKKIIAENIVKGIKKEEKTLHEQILECMNEMNMPLLMEMRKWKNQELN